METLTAIRKSGDFTVPCYGVLTDYTCIPFLAETDLDGYFIAHEDLRAELVEKGIPSDRIIVTGIPVDEKFAHHMEKAAARNYLAIPQNQDVFLIMSGGIGVGNAARSATRSSGGTAERSRSISSSGVTAISSRRSRRNTPETSTSVSSRLRKR